MEKLTLIKVGGKIVEEEELMDIWQDMAQKASELLEKESSTILADTGYYNGTEIKNCVDAG